MPSRTPAPSEREEVADVTGSTGPALVAIALVGMFAIVGTVAYWLLTARHLV